MSAIAMAWALAVCLGAGPVKREVPSLDVRTQAIERARMLSTKADYVGAAEVLKAAVITLGASKYADPNDRRTVEALEQAYEKRAALAAKASTDSRAARALMVDLLSGHQFGEEVASSDDPRIGALLTALKAIDPKAAEFFDGRSVRVSIQGDLEPSQQQAVAAAVVAVLRDLGFAAGLDASGDELVLRADRGQMVSTQGVQMLAGLGDKSVSCELKVDARWASRGKVLSAFDLSHRDLGWSDLLDRCYASCIKKVRAQSAVVIFQGFDAR